MPNWTEILEEINRTRNFDTVRRRYLKELHDVTGRNVIIYYSGWLQKPNQQGIEVNDADKNGFMAVIHQLDRDKGLDLVLHTPGGGTAATESLVDYLREMFDTNIRAFVPQLAMSAGTMIACACREIFMGAHSSLGPTDPQIGSISARGVVEEFNRAREEVREDRSTIPIWQAILSKYQPAFIGKCEKTVKWADQMVATWLETGMFKDLDDTVRKEKSSQVVNYLSDSELSISHDRHLSLKRCKEIGLEVHPLEDHPTLREAVLSVHHACIHTLDSTSVFKIIENHEGKAFIRHVPAPQNVRNIPQTANPSPQRQSPNRQPRR